MGALNLKINKSIFIWKIMANKVGDLAWFMVDWNCALWSEESEAFGFYCLVYSFGFFWNWSTGFAVFGNENNIFVSVCYWLWSLLHSDAK